MCGYNRVNGNYACANPEILNDILKDELAFPGYIVSDWEATHSAIGTANAGLDMDMSATAFPTGIYSNRLDDMATRVMAPYFRLGQDEDFPVTDPASGPVFLSYIHGHQSPLAASYPEVPARDARADHARGIRELGADDYGQLLVELPSNVTDPDA